MGKLKIYFWVLCSLLISNTLHAQIMKLDSVLAKVDHNPALAAFDSRISAYNTYAAGANSWMAPQVGTGFFMTPYNTALWGYDPDMGSQGMGSFMLSFRQMIPDAQKLSTSRSYMQSMTGMEKADKSMMRNSMHAEAKTAYYEWLMLKKKKAAMQQTAQMLDISIKSAEIRYQYNSGKLSSVYKAQAQLAELQNMLLMTDNDIKMKMVMLNTMMNRDKNIVFDIDTSYSIKNYDTDPSDTMELISSRSDLKAIDASERNLQLKQAMEKAKTRPEFGIEYDHMFAFGHQPWQFSLMPMVTIPLAPWSSGMYKANITGIDFEMQALQNQKRSLLNEAAGKVQSLKYQISYQKKMVQQYENEIIPAYRKNYQAAMLGWEQNTEEMNMVLDAIQMLKMAEITYTDQLKELLKLQVEYEKETEQL